MHQQGELMAEDKESLEAAAQNPAAVQLILGGRGALYPGAEADYWARSYTDEPYFDDARSFEDYGPAYELGWTGYNIYGGEFNTADRVLANDWVIQKGISTLSWDEARPACRAAWQRAHNATSYKSDGSASPDMVIKALKELADNACDAELGFIEAAGHTQTPALVAVFERSAQSWRAAAAELQEQSGRMGAPVEDAGTVAAAAQRVWLQIRSLFGGASDETLLAECVRGEEAALSSYRMALQQNLPAEIHALVQQQFERTQRNHDLIRSLLEQLRADEAASPGLTA
jgi:uncharacterized protein (TIGR02284 family)